MAGKVAAKALSSGDTRLEALREYEDLWRSSWGRHLEKRLKAKRFFCSLSDDDINRLAASLQESDLCRFSSADLLSLFKQNPKMLWSMRKLMM